MRSVSNLLNKRFGRWHVVKFGEFRPENSGRQRPFWECRCDCGKMRFVSGNSLMRGVSQSCGCVQQRVRSHGFCQGGHAGTNPTYKIWSGMRARCQCPTNKAYRYYGARGIMVCERWQNFENFYSDMGERPPGLTIERMDNNKGYFPDNCKWATMDEQYKNKRKPSTVKLTAGQVRCIRMLKGQKTAAAIASIYGIRSHVVYKVLANKTWREIL